MGPSAYVNACGIFSRKFDIVRQSSCFCSASDVRGPLREDEIKLAIRHIATPMPALGPDSSYVHLIFKACVEGDLGLLVRTLPGLSDETLNHETLAYYCSRALQHEIALYLIIARKLDLPILTACMLRSTVVFQIFLDLGWSSDAPVEGHAGGTGSPLL